MTDETRTIVRLDSFNIYVEHKEIAVGEGAPPMWAFAEPPSEPADEGFAYMHTSSGWVLIAKADIPVATPSDPPVVFEPRRVTKARFGDLFTFQEHAIMNLIRWQITQMDAVERSDPTNPLVFAEVLFQKFDLPTEFIELDHSLTVQGLGILGMMGVFSGNDAVRIPEILNDETPVQ